MREEDDGDLGEPDAVTDVGPLPNEFEISVGADGEPWSAVNQAVVVTVMPQGSDRAPPSKLLAGTDRPAHMWKANHIRNAMTPDAYKDQWLIAELDGVFVHIKHEADSGLVRVLVAKERLM